MSADRVRFTENITQKLVEMGCRKVAPLDEYNSQWVTPWGFLFTVPDFGPQDKCPTVMWFDILADIEKTRPADQ